jgi:hypothetical protein
MRSVFCACFAVIVTISPGWADDVDFTADTVPYEKVVHMKSIGVIYAVDDTLTIKTVGTTAFTNGEDSLPVNDWKLGDAVFDTVRVALSAHYTVTDASAKASPFRRAEDRTLHPLRNQLSDLVRFLPDQTIDTYIVIKSTESYGDPIGNTNQTLEGLGLYRHNFFEAATAAEYAFVMVYLIDARSGDILAHSSLCFGGAYGKCQHKSWQGFNAADLPPSVINLKDAQKEVLRKDFATFLATGVRSELADMGLVVDLHTPVAVSPLYPADNEVAQH